MDKGLINAHYIDIVWFEVKEGCDVTDVLLHANIGEGENVYVDTPKDFDQYLKTGHKKCLKFKNTLYGIYQSPRKFWKYLTKNLEACGLNQ